MSKTERHRLIFEAVQATGRVRVVELAQRTGVSEMTVRRDLEDLEEGGVLTRVHGGAVSNVSRSFEPGFTARSLQQATAKQRIGVAAAALVREGEALVIDAGTTTVQVARALPQDLHVRVLALSLHVADELADMPNVTLMLPGGTVRRHERSFIGTTTVMTFTQLNFDTVILTCGGMDVTAGVTEYEPDDAEVKQAALRSARRVVVAVDSSKLGAVAFVRVCPLELVDVVVTDTDAPPEHVAALREAGVDVVLA